MRTLHGIFDINNDGVISFDDFKLLAQNFGDLGHLSQEEMAEFLVVLQVRKYLALSFTFYVTVCKIF
jgi:Ca2+-binding EF-hand superfamily protein